LLATEASSVSGCCGVCGLKTDQCQKWKSLRPALWSFAHSPVGSRTGTLVPSATEIAFAIDGTTILNPSLAVEPAEVMAQTEQVHRQNVKLEPALQEEQESRAKTKELEKSQLRTLSPKKRRQPSTMGGYAMVSAGVLSLAISVYATSSVLAFIGLGLTFWGALLLFIRPQKYVTSELLDSTAFSSLRNIDRVMTEMGYFEKGIYLPGGNPEKAVVFVPAEPFGRIPKAKEIEGQMFIDDPKGLAMIPPGLALASLIEKKLGVPLEKCTLETLGERLPKLMVEDLEMAQDFQMHVKGNQVIFNFNESVYSDFCHTLSGSTRVCAGLGCPICSAMACVLTIATGKPVSFEGDKFSADGKSLESSYKILDEA